MNSMRKLLSFIVLMLCNCFVFSQSNYSQTNFRVSQSVYTDISVGGTSIAMTDAIAGNSTTPQAIGFTFNFNGTAFTQFMIHADGILRLGTDAPGAATVIAANPSLANGAVFTNTTASFQNVLMPFFTNLIAGSSTPEFHVQTTGTAPNRICTIQWKNLADADNAGTAAHQFSNLEFQVKLYETSNDIEFVYGTFTPTATAVAARNAVSGIKATSTSFFGLYKVNSFMPYQKTVVFNPTNHGRINSSYPFRNNVIPASGLSNRFFGRLTNDVHVGKIYYDSIAPLGSQTTGRLETLLVNDGINALTNISVALNITGANTHSDVVNVASLAAGASQRIAFPAYNLPNKGQQNVVVTATAAGDERAENNALTVKQVVSQSHQQTLDRSTNSTLGVGFSTTNNISAVKMYGSGIRKIKQVRIPFGSYRNIVNVRIYEDGGTGGGPSGAALFTSSNFFTTSENLLTVTLGDGVTVNGDYFIAVQQTTSTNMAWRIFLNPPKRNDRYFNSSNNGTSWGLDATDPPWELMAEAYEESPATDIGIERLTTPGCDYSTATDVKVTLRNFSATPIDFASTPTSITGTMQNPAGTQFPFSIQKNTGILAAGAFEEITVLNNYDFSSRGFHRINARTNLTGDVEAGNDSLSFFINNSVAVTRSVPDPICPITSVTLTGPAFLANVQWNVDGSISSGTTRVIAPLKTTIVRISGTDYRNCLLQDSIIITVKGDGLPPRPMLIFGDTILSHRNEFKDTVRVQKLAGHTIQFVELFANGTILGDSAYALSTIVGMNGAKVAAAYVRTADGCANLSDTLIYRYSAGVLHNENNITIQVCDTSFYDAGGPTGNTGNSIVRTFTPATPGSKLKLTFYRIDLASFAGLRVFDGTSTSSPRIQALENLTGGNTVREFIASNQEGALTVQFTVGSGQSQGWWAGLTCYTSEIYRTVESGNWISASTWERKVPGGVYTPAIRPPFKGDDSVYVLHNVTLTTSTPMDQIVVEEGATLNFESPTVNFISMPVYKTVPQPELLIKGTLNISPRVQIFGNNGQMVVSGRLNNFGQIDLDSVVFNGTTPQTLGNFSGASGSMKLLHLNNPAGLTMGSDQQMQGIRFVQGMINSNSENLITLTEGKGFTTGASNAAHVNGPVQVQLSGSSGDRFFPIGKNGIYRPVMVRNSNSNSESSDAITAEVITGPAANRTLPNTIDAVSAVRYYRITRSGTSGLDYTVTLPYGSDDGVTNADNLTVAKDNGAGAWLDLGGTSTGPTPGTITSGTFNGFSDFVLASKNGALPVTWLSFEATAIANDVMLQWRTGTEANCKNYEVQRSADGQTFTTIGMVACKNIATGATYNYTDKTAQKGTWYYRLRQIDRNGQFSYSAVRRVVLNTITSIVVYPNPAQQFFIVSGIQKPTRITLFDAIGKPVLSKVIASSATQIDIQHVPAGSYYLLVEADGERLRYPLQIIR